MEIKKQQTEKKEKRKIIYYEDYIRKLGSIVDKAEDDFFQKNQKYPDLTNEEDYVLLADSLDMQNQDEIFGDIEVQIDKKRTKKIPRSSFLTHDLGQQLIKRFIKRQGIFSGENQDEILEAILGNAIYNCPRSEYAKRVESIEKLIQAGVPFPKEWNSLIDTLTKIKKTCFLHNLYEQDKEKYKKGYYNIGDFIVNPSGTMKNFLGRRRSWEDLMNLWNSLGH